MSTVCPNNNLLYQQNRGTSCVMAAPLPQYSDGRRIRSSDPHEPVAILGSVEGLEAVEPVTVCDLFLDTVKKFPERTAICYKKDIISEWKEISYEDYYRFSFEAAKSFVKVYY